MCRLSHSPPSGKLGDVLKAIVLKLAKSALPEILDGPVRG